MEGGSEVFEADCVGSVLEKIHPGNYCCSLGTSVNVISSINIASVLFHLFLIGK